jgi:arylsulfatase A-like enzyme
MFETASPSDHRSRPNVLIFFTDQQRHDTVGLHGNPLDITPNFDRLARRGTHLSHAFTPQPVCGPARACLQTGLYATAHGSYRNGIALDPELPTLGTLFNDAGYATGYIGKWHLGDDSAVGPVAPRYRRGYEFWLAAQALEHTSDAYRTRLWDRDGAPHDLPGFRVDALADATIRYVSQRDASRPFFLMTSFLEPHHQNSRDDYPAPEGYAERYAGRWTPPDLTALGGTAAQHLGGYFGMVRRLDEALGRIADALHSLGLLDDTIVLFLSDHGCHFKTRNGEYKRSPHESSIRGPAMLHGGPFTGGGEVSQLVSLLDLPPTLLDACGIDAPASMQGRSLLPLVRDPRSTWPDDVFVQISESQLGRAVRTRRWKYTVVAPDRSGWNDSASTEYAEAELYDLHADPCELHNLIASHGHDAVKRRMRERLLNRMTDAGELSPAIRAAESRRLGQLAITPGEEDE